MSTETPGPVLRQSWLREPVNALTHAFGALLGLIGLVFLLVRGSGNPAQIISFSVYGAGMILLFTASALYHAARVSDRALRRLRTFDHVSIYVLIAATYTPVTLVSLQPQFSVWGWSLFGVVWGLALTGIIIKLFWLNAPRWLTAGVYLVIGWLAVIGIRPVLASLSSVGVAWLLSGGLSYSIGAVIYALKRPDPFPGVFGFHEIWHVFVLMGAASHFFMMYFDIAG